MHKSHRAINRAQQSFSASPSPPTTVYRSLSTCPSTRSPSASAPPPTARVDRKDRSLYRKVIATAVRGAYELSAHPSPRPHSLAAHGFRPPKLRATPTSRDGQRAKLVDFDPARVAQSGYSRNPAKRPPQPKLPRKREFSTSARCARASEDSLELEQNWLDVDAGDWDADRAGGHRLRMPKPGDWVETRRNGQSAFGIYLSPGVASARRFLILPVSGERTELGVDDITYVLPGVVPAATAASANFVNSPELSPSAPAALEMLQKLREVEFAIDEETKLIVSRGVSDLYRLLHTPPTPSTPAAGSSKKRPFSPPISVTISQALKALRLSNSSALNPSQSSHSIPLARQIAMHRLLLEDAVHFLADGLALRVSAKFDLRDSREAERFEKVRDWTRHQSDEMKTFAAKAAKVREWGRTNASMDVRGRQASRNLDRIELPSGDDEVRRTFTWTKYDQEIIRFLRDTLAYDRVLQVQPHMAIAPSVLKLVDQQSLELGYEGWVVDSDVKKARIREFLSEIGEVAKWENWVAHEKGTGLQRWEEMGKGVERALERGSAAKQSTPTAKSTGSLASTEYYPQDPHDAVRHDFGNVAVYTIDDAGAFELDDGISLSPAPRSPSGKTTHWVYVHIADPTALLHPGHLVSKLARVRDHTEYFPEKTWSMLPDSFVEKEKLSLGSRDGAEQRTMSFGMRIEEETGQVLESEVKVGIVRNVLRLTYAGVDEALGHAAPPPKKMVQFPAPSGGGIDNVSNKPRPRRQIDDDLLKTNPEAVPALRTLHQISKKLLARRAADSALFWNFPTASVSVSPSIFPSFSTKSQPTFYSSSPLVNLYLPSPGDQSFVDSPASLLVSELMVAANRTAAKFSVENGLAVPFRTQGAPSATREAIEQVLNLRDPATGQASAIEVLKKGVDFVPGSNTTKAGPHWPMGINDSYGYVKVTSPLRRYSDLFSHWQLKSALLPRSSAPAYATPRFDVASVQSHIEGFDVAAKARHRLSEAASTFWSLFVISRKWSLLNDLSSSSSRTRTTSVVSSSSLDMSRRDDEEFLDLLAGGLTAIPLRIAAHSAFDNLYVQPVLIPQLGVRGTLQVEKLDMAGQVGEEVPVKIDDVVLSARSKVVVSRRR